MRANLSLGPLLSPGRTSSSVELNPFHVLQKDKKGLEFSSLA